MNYFIEVLNHKTELQLGCFLMSFANKPDKDTGKVGSPKNFKYLQKGDIVFHFFTKDAKGVDREEKETFWGYSMVSSKFIVYTLDKNLLPKKESIKNFEIVSCEDEEEMKNKIINDISTYYKNKKRNRQFKFKIEDIRKFIEESFEKKDLTKEKKKHCLIVFLENRISNKKIKIDRFKPNETYLYKKIDDILPLLKEAFDISDSLMENPLNKNNDIDSNKVEIIVKENNEITEEEKKKIKESIFLKDEEIDEILKLIEVKKNLIFQGPPGTGKTFTAYSIALLLSESKDRIEKVQFHQSYSYEDFIMGYKPSENGGFELKEGIFYKFVNKAKNNLEKKYVFIIDEINRGNLSRIFGELLFLIESDKREEKYSLKLTYSDKEFYVPDNLYIIGTMNTADRSLALVDYALRRRFVFKTLDPILDIEKNKKLEKYFKVHGFKNKEIDDMKNRLKKIDELNGEINNDLGKGFKIGHSYFLSLDGLKDIKKWYENVIEYEIKPLLEEYYFDEQENEIEKKIKSLKDMNNSEDNKKN